MPGLSSDPAKAQNQLHALAAGRRVLAERVLGAEPPAKAEAKADQGTPPAPADDRVTYPEEDHDPAPEPEPEPEPAGPAVEPPSRGGGGFLDGILGRV